MKKFLCVDCGVTDPVKFYPVNKSRCKIHVAARVRENRLKNILHYTEYERGRASLPHRVAAREKYLKTPEGRKASARAKTAWIERNGLKYAAHTIVNNFVRDGKLDKLPCEFISLTGKRCGARDVQAHHDDYTKPLEVRWLCKKHHDDHHWRKVVSPKKAQ